MKSNWEKDTVRKDFLDFQAIHPNVTVLQKEIHSELHSIDNDLYKISQDDDFNDENCENYYELLKSHFEKVFYFYKKLYD